MKANIFKLTAIMLIMAGSLGSCEKTYNSEIIVDEIVDVFELKYGDLKTFNYNGQTLVLSINTIENNLVDCSVIDFIDQETMQKVRIHCTLNMNIRNKNQLVKVSSQACQVLEYINDGSDVQHIIDIISELRSSPNPDYFGQEFPRYFGNSTLIKNTGLCINIAKAYPIYDDQGDSKSYKFIFILSKPK